MAKRISQETQERRNNESTRDEYTRLRKAAKRRVEKRLAKRETD